MKQWSVPETFAAIMLGLLLAVPAGCGDQEDLPEPVMRDMSAIRAGDTIVALMAYNSTGYFLYRGQALGYEYELLHEFADDNDLVLQTRIVRHRDSLMRLLAEGAGDIVAARIVPKLQDTSSAAFTLPLYSTRPALVQRQAPPTRDGIPDSAESKLELDDTIDAVAEQGTSGSLPDSVVLNSRLIRRPWELGGHKIHLPGSSPYHDRLVEISDDVTGDVEIVELSDDVSSETVIRGVSFGRYSLTVAPENLAQLKESYFSNIVVRPALGPSHSIAWAVRPNAPDLLEELNSWIEQTRSGSKLFDRLYDKYFVDRQGYRERTASEYLASETGVLSDYDTLLKTYAPEIDWDWRLLAAQTYQESRFKPNARSWAGAMGLLQLMPGTASDMKVGNPYDPQQNVRGAVDYLEYLTGFWHEKITDPQQRLKFILASYNAGAGHVLDAQRLTRRYGGDARVWDDVAYWLLQLSKEQFYTDEVVRHGFCRGLEPVTYVARILERYEHYRQFVVS